MPPAHTAGKLRGAIGGAFEVGERDVHDIEISIYSGRRIMSSTTRNKTMVGARPKPTLLTVARAVHEIR